MKTDAEKTAFQLSILVKILEVLQFNRRRSLCVTKTEKNESVGTLAGGEAAFFALEAIQNLYEAHPEWEVSEDDTIPIPKWVFDELVEVWLEFLKNPNPKNSPLTLGQLIGCEPTYQGGREGPKRTADRWTEVRMVGFIRWAKVKLKLESTPISNLNAAIDLADTGLLEDGFLENRSSHSIIKYMKKYKFSREKPQR